MDLTGKVAIVTGSRPGPRPRLRHRTRRRRRRRRHQRRRRGRRRGRRRHDHRRRRHAPSPRSSPSARARPPQALVDRAVKEFGRLDILVNNAGILRDTTLWKMTDEDFDAVITTHLRGTFTCTRAAASGTPRAGRGRPDHLRRLPHRPGRQLRADQLRRRQGRHRRHGPHLGDGARPRRDHRQRDRPGRRHRDDRDGPLPQALRRRRWRGLPAPSRARELASAPPRTPPGWSPSSPPTPPPASPARPSASAATGSPCGRTRARSSSSSPTAPAGRPTRSPRRSSQVAEVPQTVGRQQAPRAPAQERDG